jgi:hypothetical protein
MNINPPNPQQPPPVLTDADLAALSASCELMADGTCGPDPACLIHNSVRMALVRECIAGRRGGKKQDVRRRGRRERG